MIHLNSLLRARKERKGAWEMEARGAGRSTILVEDSERMERPQGVGYRVGALSYTPKERQNGRKRDLTTTDGGKRYDFMRGGGGGGERQRVLQGPPQHNERKIEEEAIRKGGAKMASSTLHQGNLSSKGVKKLSRIRDIDTSYLRVIRVPKRGLRWRRGENDLVHEGLRCSRNRELEGKERLDLELKTPFNPCLRSVW